MRFSEILSTGHSAPVSNEEHKLLSKITDDVLIAYLSEREQWIAQGLVRKGLLDVEDDVRLVKRTVH